MWKVSLSCWRLKERACAEDWRCGLVYFLLSMASDEEGIVWEGHTTLGEALHVPDRRGGLRWRRRVGRGVGGVVLGL